MICHQPLLSHLQLKFGKPNPVPYVISSDSLLLSSYLKSMGVKSSDIGEIIINTFLDWLLPRGATALFPAFSWDYCKGLDFDINKSRSYTGALSRYAKNLSFKRTFHPIYSFYVIGKHSHELLDNRSADAFCKHGIFSLIYNLKGKNLFLGKNFSEMFTFIHLAENKANVEYRYNKLFTAKYTGYDFEDKLLGFYHYVRDTDKCLSTGMDKEYQNRLFANNFLRSDPFENIILQELDIVEAVDIAHDDLMKNRDLVFPVDPNNPKVRDSIVTI